MTMKTIDLYVRDGRRFVRLSEVQRGDVVELGYWCEYEGMYFTDESEIEKGHFDMPCGDGDPDGEYWAPHIVTTVAVVEVPR